MTDRTDTVKGKQYVRFYMEVMLEAEMTMGDTVTVGDFTNSSNMAQCWLVNKQTGALITSSISNNVVTMTGAGTNLRVIIFAVGIAA
jgi:hypothetical protein